jgi:nucleoside-diphosphate-sugar epimerase
LSGQTILVTGASGFLGSCVVRQLAAVPCRIRRLDRRVSLDTRPGGTAEIEDVSGDVRDPHCWAAAVEGVDVVFHLAGQTSVYVANDNPGEDLVANVMPVNHLAEACRVHQRRPVVVLAGTATVVGLTEAALVDESHPDHPITFYDLHKWMAEQYIEAYTRAGVMAGTTLRLANVYGPGPQGSSSDRGFLNAMVRRALAGETLTMYGTGAFVRDYVFVEDVARAFLSAAAAPDAVEGRHFLIGTGRGTTLAQALALVAERVARKTGHRVSVVSVDPPPGLSPIEQRNFVADTTRFRNATGWSTRVSLEDGIDQTIESACV